MDTAGTAAESTDPFSSSVKLPIVPSCRRSERLSQEAVKTKHLRRIGELFWDTDKRYQQDEEEHASETMKQKQPSCGYKSIGRLKLKKIHDSPHIYTVENFLTESELFYLGSQIEMAERNGCFKTSVVDAPTTSLVVVHPKKSKKVQKPNPGDRLAVLWEIHGENECETDCNYPLERHNGDKELMPWGATVLKKPQKAVFSITKNTPGITQMDHQIFQHLNNLTVYTLEYDIYEEAGYGHHTYCDVAFLSDRLLYDITSQEILKYIVTSSSNNNGSSLSSSANQILLSPDYDEDGLSAYLYTSNNHKNASFQTSQRTSKFIHFSKAHHTKIISIERRAAELLGVPTDCIEPLQLVRYQQGEYFQPHHDLGTLYDDGTVELPPSSFLFPPRRLVTIFVYINDVPEGCGGATKFPLLSEQDVLKSHLKDGGTLQIQPKRGMALLFCNIDRLGFPEPSTVHSGEPLISLSAYSKAGKRSKVESIPRETSPIHEESKTIKYGINIWACER